MYLFGFQEVSDQLRRVRNEEVEVFVDGEDGHDGVATDVRVTVLQTTANRWHQRLEQFGLLHNNI